jgi:hypothetical protein
MDESPKRRWWEGKPGDDYDKSPSEPSNHYHYAGHYWAERPGKWPYTYRASRRLFVESSMELVDKYPWLHTVNQWSSSNELPGCPITLDCECTDELEARWKAFFFWLFDQSLPYRKPDALQRITDQLLMEQGLVEKWTFTPH